METIAYQSGTEAASIRTDAADRLRRSEHELFALRGSVKLLDLELAMAVTIGDGGIRLSLRCGSDSSESDKKQLT